MADTCPAISRGEGEADVLLKLLRRSGVLDKDIDTGVLRSNFKQNRSPVERVPGTAGDGILSPNEIYGAASEKQLKEQDRYVESGGKTSRPFTDLVSKCSTHRNPLLFNDFDPNSTWDNNVLLGIGKKVAEIRRETITDFFDKGKIFSVGSAEFNKQYLQNLVLWMEDAVVRKKYVPYESTNLELMQGAPGDCTELSRFAYAVLRIAGFKPEFLKISKHAFNPKIRHHIAVGVPLDLSKPDRLTHIDLYHRGFLHNNRHHLGWIRLTHNGMLAETSTTSAGHLIKTRNRLLEKEKNLKIEHSPALGPWFSKLERLATRALILVVSGAMLLRYSQAMAYDSYSPNAYYSAAITLHKLGIRHKIISTLIQKALDLNPTDPDVLDFQKTVYAYNYE